MIKQLKANYQVKRGSINFLIISSRVIIVLLIVFCFGCSATKSISKNNLLPDLKRQMVSGENHVHHLHLNANEFTHIQVQQEGIDVIAKVSSDDKLFSEKFDMPNGELDAEDIYLLADRPTNYKIELIPAQKYADPGNYLISIARYNKATEFDKIWMKSISQTQKADNLRSKTELAGQCLEEYKIAANAWKNLGDTLQYARVMRSLGFVYIRQKNYEEALLIFNQLLPTWNQLKDTRSEGFTYLIIGRIYTFQNNLNEAVQYNINSLPFWKKANDSDQESFTLMNIGNLYSRMNQPAKAFNYFDEALKINEQSSRPSVKAVILRDYANAMALAGKSQLAIGFYKQSYIQWQATTNRPEEARTAIKLATVLVETKNNNDALYYYNQAYKIWEKLGDQQEMDAVSILIKKMNIN